MAETHELILMNHFYDLSAQLAQQPQGATDGAKGMEVIAIIRSREMMATKGFYKW